MWKAEVTSKIVFGLLPPTEGSCGNKVATAAASSAVFVTLPVTCMAESGTPCDLAQTFSTSPSGVSSGCQGTQPPVKTSQGAFPARYSSIPPQNRSPSFHSLVPAVPGAKILPSLSTTMAWALGMLLAATRTAYASHQRSR